MFNFSLAVGLSQSGKLSAAWQGYKIGEKNIRRIK